MRPGDVAGRAEAAGAAPRSRWPRSERPRRRSRRRTPAGSSAKTSSSAGALPLRAAGAVAAAAGSPSPARFARFRASAIRPMRLPSRLARSSYVEVPLGRHASITPPSTSAAPRAMPSRSACVASWFTTRGIPAAAACSRATASSVKIGRAGPGHRQAVPHVRERVGRGRAGRG